MSNQEIKRDYLKFCETNPHDENYTIPTVDLESLFTLIDQQAVKIANYERHANEFIYGESEEGSTHFEKMEASLNLAVKALERIEDYWEANITVKTYARDALDQIRRTET